MTFRKNGKWAKATNHPAKGWVVAFGWSGNFRCNKMEIFGKSPLNRSLAAHRIVGWLND